MKNMSNSIQAKLYDFKVEDIESEEIECKYKDNKEFSIQLFLINNDKDLSITINDFYPHFYIKCPGNWKPNKKLFLINTIKNYIGKYYYRGRQKNEFPIGCLEIRNHGNRLKMAGCRS